MVVRFPLRSQAGQPGNTLTWSKQAWRRGVMRRIPMRRDPDLPSEQELALFAGVRASAGQAPRVGTDRSGSGFAVNRRRHGLAMRRAHRFARLTRALSVAIPVFAYIWR